MSNTIYVCKVDGCDDFLATDLDTIKEGLEDLFRGKLLVHSTDSSGTRTVNWAGDNRDIEAKCYPHKTMYQGCFEATTFTVKDGLK